MTNLDKEGNRLATIQETVVVSESKVHHLFGSIISTCGSRLGVMTKRKSKKSYRADFNLAIHNHGLVLDRV